MIWIRLIPESLDTEMDRKGNDDEREDWQGLHLQMNSSNVNECGTK